MEFVSAGNLCTFVKRRRRLPEDEARKIFLQISVAIEYMHSLEIIHRDVKLENVLLDKDGFQFKANMDKLNQAMRAIRASQLPPDEKRLRLEEIQKARVALSRAVVGAE